MALLSKRTAAQAEKAADGQDRLPPGQFLTQKWPVLHVGPVPAFVPEAWDFRVTGLVERPVRFTWGEFGALPQVHRVSDIHCVTTWSKYDNAWDGVATREIAARAGVKPEACFVIVHSENGYTTNLPLDAFLAEDALFAIHHDGAPLEPDHGYPLRLVVPALYFWKSAKWVRGIEFVAGDRPGFWEERGYNNHGDPWKEERYW
jgi:DMSO/TMAO reductase YedYZ molybdopterin-dependent catalytic subunit